MQYFISTPYPPVTCLQGLITATPSPGASAQVPGITTVREPVLCPITGVPSPGQKPETVTVQLLFKGFIFFVFSKS
jgi:hypothetical protein